MNDNTIQHSAIQPTAIRVFDFKEFPIRVFPDDQGASWWVATDICRAVAIANSRNAVARLDDDERMTVCFADSHSGKRGGARSFQVINESGLYALILGSRKAEAKRFRKWVTSIVLPEIRKTGSYVAPNADVSALVAKTAALVDRLDAMEARNGQLAAQKGVLEQVNRQVVLEKAESRRQVERYVAYIDAVAQSDRAFYTLADFLSRYGITNPDGAPLDAGERRRAGKILRSASIARGIHLPRYGDGPGLVNWYRWDVLRDWAAAYQIRVDGDDRHRRIMRRYLFPDSPTLDSP